MLLSGTNGDSLALNITGYQFPEASDLQKRYSWHVVEGGSSCEESNWSFRFAALTCAESVRLANWLRDTGDGQVTAPVLEFTEPNLRFEIVGRSGDQVILEVGLNQEFGAPSGPAQETRNPKTLRLQLSLQALQTAAEQWQSDVDRYPALLDQ